MTPLKSWRPKLHFVPSLIGESQKCRRMIRDGERHKDAAAEKSGSGEQHQVAERLEAGSQRAALPWQLRCLVGDNSRAPCLTHPHTRSAQLYRWATSTACLLLFIQLFAILKTNTSNHHSYRNRHELILLIYSCLLPNHYICFLLLFACFPKAPQFITFQRRNTLQ